MFKKQISNLFELVSQLYAELNKRRQPTKNIGKRFE